MNKRHPLKEHSSISNEGNVAYECRHIELSDLDHENVGHEQESKQQQVLPPDGGIRAYLVLLSAFISFGVANGVMWYYGNIISFNFSSTSHNRFFTFNITFMMAPITGILADKIGLQYTSMAGGVLIISGLFFSTYFLHNLSEFNVTFFILGCQIVLGTALCLTSAYAILGQYFKRHLGKASAFVTMGWLLMFAVMKTSSFTDDLRFKFQMLSLISSLIIVCSITFKPLHPLPKKCFRVDLDRWKLLKFFIYAIGVTIAMLGFVADNVPMYILLREKFQYQVDDYFGSFFHYFTYISGYLIFGTIADLRCVNRISLQQILFICIGLGNIAMTYISKVMLVEVLGMILCLLQCCFITFLCPIVFEMFGPSGATYAIGILLNLWAYCKNWGYDIFNYGYNKSNSIEAPFVLAGLFPIIGAVIMFGALRILDRHIRK